MSENIRLGNGYPAQILDFSVGNAMQAADIASGMAYGFGRDIPDGYRVRRAARGLVGAQVSMDRAAPYVDVIGSFENPGEQLGADLEEIRSAVETNLFAQNTGMTPEEAAQAVTPDQVAESVGALLDGLFAPPETPGALQAPLVRGLAEVYAKQKLGPDAVPADLIRKRPPKIALRAAAPEILLALGFDPSHPMVASANRGGIVRHAANLFAGSKLRAVTRTPELARQIQATLPPSGEQLKQNFARVRAFLGALTTPTTAGRAS